MAARSSPCLPQRFVIVPGAPKAGTTSLFLYLAVHPAIVASKVKKQTDYFFPLDYEHLPGPRLGNAPLSEYAALFGKVNPDQLALDASDGYFQSAEALRAIAATLPDTRLVVCLREPVSRLKSFYAMLRPHMPGPEPMSFDAYVEQMFARRAAGERRNYYWLGLEHGLYAESMKLAFELFGRHNVHIVWFDRLEADVRAEVMAMARFIGIDPAYYATRELLPQMETRQATPGLAASIYAGLKRLASRAASGSPSMKKALRRLKARWDTPLSRSLTLPPSTVVAQATTLEKLVEFYREDAVRLGTLLGEQPYWYERVEQERPSGFASSLTT